MAQRKLRTVLNEFLHSLQECRLLAADAYRWSLPGAHPHISRNRCDHIIEMAFMRAFLAWEVFIEESFILYLAGQSPPRGRAPLRYAFPLNIEMAMDWVIPEGRTYAGWTNPKYIIERAERFFRKGRPFTTVLKSNSNTFDDARKIRNAIAHKSMSARDKFEKCIRPKLGALQPNITVGQFLVMIEPHTTPPKTFLEFYVNKIELAARQIVPM